MRNGNGQDGPGVVCEQLRQALENLSTSERYLIEKIDVTQLSETQRLQRQFALESSRHAKEDCAMMLERLSARLDQVARHFGIPEEGTVSDEFGDQIKAQIQRACEEHGDDMTLKQIALQLAHGYSLTGVSEERLAGVFLEEISVHLSPEGLPRTIVQGDRDDVDAPRRAYQSCTPNQIREWRSRPDTAEQILQWQLEDQARAAASTVQRRECDDRKEQRHPQ